MPECRISYEEKKELLWKMYEQTQDRIVHADQKAQSNLTLLSIIMAATFIVLSGQELVNTCTLLALLAVTLIFLSMFLSILVLVGRGVSRDDIEGNLFAFHTYSSQPIEELERLLSMSRDEYIRRLLEELREISEIAREKYRLVNYAFHVLSAAAAFLLMALICKFTLR